MAARYKYNGTVKGYVADLEKRKSPIPQGGVEIRLKLTFQHANLSIVEQLVQYIRRYRYDWDENQNANDVVSYSSGEETDEDNNN